MRCSGDPAVELYNKQAAECETFRSLESVVVMYVQVFIRYFCSHGRCGLYRKSGSALTLIRADEL